MALIAEDDELFQFPELAVETIESPDQHGVPLPIAQILQQAQVLGSRLPVEGAAVVVDVDVRHGPATTFCLGQAVNPLTGDAKLVAEGVGRDSQVDGSGLRGHQGTLAYPGSGQGGFTRHPRLAARESSSAIGVETIRID